MSDITSAIKTARDQGYSDPEIIDHLAKKDPRFATAAKEGYSLDEITTHFNNTQPVTQGLFGTSIGENSDLLRKARIPAQMSRQGLKSITDAIPDAQTQSVPLNMVLNTPKALGEVGSEFSAGMLDPETAITAGVLKGASIAAPAINAVGRTIGRGAEAISGLGYKTPGILAQTVSEPSLPFGKGLDAAREIYKGVQDMGAIRDELKSATSKEDFLQKSLGAFKDGSLTPDEGLEARKVVRSMKKKLPDASYHYLVDTFDNFAKQKFSEADAAFSKAIKSEALREFFPMNKGGTPSIFKVGIGGATIPHLMPLTSPAVQGLAASAVGMTKQAALPIINNPLTSSTLLNAFRNRKKE